MVYYLGLLQVRTYEVRQELKEVQRRYDEIELETIKEYFKIGKKVIYKDYRSEIRGVVIAIDERDIKVKIDYIDDDYNCERHLSFEENKVMLFKAKDLNLYNE